MDYVLSTDNLVKSYGQARALSGLSMHVPKGAIYGIVGRNGAGKTTLIRLICGLQRPTSCLLYTSDPALPGTGWTTPASCIPLSRGTSFRPYTAFPPS